MIRQGKSYYIMFDVEEGGMIKPIEFNGSNLQPERSILVMDEETQTVWLWHGAKRALVPRRMALRQAESLKGHGYQAGNAIVGRDLSKIIEIDARKVGREPETTECNDRLMALLNRKFTNIGHFLHVVDDGQVETPKSLPMKQKEITAPVPVPQPVKTPAPQPVKAPAPQPVKEPVSEIPMEPTSEYEDESLPISPKHVKEEHSSPTPTPSKPVALPDLKMTPEQLKKAAVILAVLEEFKDVWISRKENDLIALEQMDGRICSFKIENGEIQYQPGSFTEIGDSKRQAIEAQIKKLI